MSTPKPHRAKNPKSNNNNNNPVDAKAFINQIKRREGIASGYRLGFWPQPLFKVSRKIVDTESVTPRQVQKIETLPEEVLSQICDQLAQIETKPEADNQGDTSTSTSTSTSTAINFALACKAFAKAFNYHIRADVNRRVNGNIDALISAQLAGTHRYCDQCDLWRSTDRGFWMQVIDFAWSDVRKLLFNTSNVHTTAGQIEGKKAEIDSWVDAWCCSSSAASSAASSFSLSLSGCSKSTDGQGRSDCSHAHSYLTPTIFYSSCPGHFAHQLLLNASTASTTAISNLEEFWAKCEQKVRKPGLSVACCSCK